MSSHQTASTPLISSRSLSSHATHGTGNIQQLTLRAFDQNMLPPLSIRVHRKDKVSLKHFKRAAEPDRGSQRPRLVRFVFSSRVVCRAHYIFFRLSKSPRLRGPAGKGRGVGVTSRRARARRRRSTRDRPVKRARHGVERTDRRAAFLPVKPTRPGSGPSVSTVRYRPSRRSRSTLSHVSCRRGHHHSPSLGTARRRRLFQRWWGGEAEEALEGCARRARTCDAWCSS